MKILFLTHFYSPEIAAAAKRMSGLAKNLKKLGHDVEVLTGFPSYPTGKKPQGHIYKVYMEEELEGIKVYRYYVYSSPKKSSLNRILNYASFMLSSLFFIFKNKKYDVIITTSPPLFIGLSGYIISRVKRMPFVFDIRDVWPDIAAEMGEIKVSSIMYKVLNRIAGLLYKKADLITVVNGRKKEKLINKGIDSNKIHVISNGFDREFLDFPVDVQLVERYKLKENFVIIYAGLVGLAQGLDIIIGAAGQLKCHTGIKFIVIGDGAEKEELEDKVKKLNLDNIQFIGVQPHEKIYTFLKYAGASIVPLKNENLKDSVPTKMLEALGAGCPVILGASGEAAGILLQSGGGVVIKPGNARELAGAVIGLYNYPQKREEMKEKGQSFILGNFTRDVIAQRLSDTLKKFNQGG